MKLLSLPLCSFTKEFVIPTLYNHLCVGVDKKSNYNKTALFLYWSNSLNIHLFKFSFYIDPHFIKFSDQISILLKQILKTKKIQISNLYLILCQVYYEALFLLLTYQSPTDIPLHQLIRKMFLEIPHSNS